MKKAALLTALAFSLTGFAQDGKLGFQKGRKLEVTTEMKREASSGATNKSMEYTITSAMTTIYDVQDVNPGGSVLEHKIKRLSFNAEGMGEIDSFDSEKESDMNDQLGKVIGKSIKNKYTLTLNPSGKITAVRLDDDNPGEKDDPLGEMIRFTIFQVGLPLSIPKTGTASVFHILPMRQLKQGDTWTDSSSIEGFQQKSFYTVTGITDTEIMLDFSEDLNTGSKMMLLGTEAILASKNRSAGKIIVDRKTGILRQKTFTTTVEGVFKANGQSRPSKEKVTTTIVVK